MNVLFPKIECFWEVHASLTSPLSHLLVANVPPPSSRVSRLTEVSNSPYCSQDSLLFLPPVQKSSRFLALHCLVTSSVTPVPTSPLKILLVPRDRSSPPSNPSTCRDLNPLNLTTGSFQSRDGAKPRTRQKNVEMKKTLVQSEVFFFAKYSFISLTWRVEVW